MGALGSSLQRFCAAQSYAGRRRQSGSSGVAHGRCLTPGAPKIVNEIVKWKDCTAECCKFRAVPVGSRRLDASIHVGASSNRVTENSRDSCVVWISCYEFSVASSSVDQSASSNAETWGAVSRNLDTAQAMHALSLSPLSNSPNRSNAVSWLGPISTDTSMRPCRRRSRCAWVRCRPCPRRWSVMLLLTTRVPNGVAVFVITPFPGSSDAT
jgi:hypothetical protein